jgi:cyclohexadienyl dehydratase
MGRLKQGRSAGWRAVALGAVMLLAHAAGPPVIARPLAEIKAQGVLRVGLTGDYAPFSLRGPDGAFVGADVGMARSLASALEVNLVLVPTSWRTLSSDLVADRFDVAMGGVSVTQDRAALGDFSHPVLRDGKRPIVRCADKDRFISLASIDQPGVRVVVNPGGTNERFARNTIHTAPVTLHADNRTIFEEIAEGRADVMVTDGAEVDFQASRHAGVLCAGAVARPFDQTDKAFWMTRDPQLKQAVDHWLDARLAAGDYDRALKAAAAR